MEVENYDLPVLEYNFKYTPHILLFSVLFLFQYFTKAKEINANLDPLQKKAGDKLFYKYMIVLQIAKAADWCLGPYVYEFYEKHHRLDLASIGKMMAVSFLSNLFMGPLLIGYLNDKSDRKFPCILYGFFLGISSLVRQIKSPLALVFSQIFFGMASSVLYTSFENWFVCEVNEKIKDKDVKDVILSAAFEKSMVSDSINAVATNFITGVLKVTYGIQAPYFFSVFLSVISIFSTIFLLDSHIVPEDKTSQHELIDVISNLKESFVQCYKTPFIILIGLSESLLFSVLHIFIFAWTPALKEFEQPFESQEVFTLFMIALMVGGTSFRAIYLFFDSDSFKVAKIISAISTICFLFSNFWISYKSTIYSFVIYEVTVGMLYPTYSKIKSEYLPQTNRGTLMNIFKIPLNLVVIFTLVTMNSVFSLKQLFVIKFCISLFVLILQLIFFNKEPVKRITINTQPNNVAFENINLNNRPLSGDLLRQVENNIAKEQAKDYYKKRN